jgi:hypothetical protein
MALVRRGAKAYYYQSYRTGGRVTSRYLFGGDVAEACAWLDAHYRDEGARSRARYRRQMAALEARERRLRRRLRRAWRRDRAALGKADALLADWYKRVEAVFRGAMAAAGCHQHKGTWRKRRMNAQEWAEAERRYHALWDRIEAGDPSLVGHVKGVFDASPEELTREWGGDLAARVVDVLTTLVAGKHLYKREAVARKLAAVRADLEGPDPSPGVRLLAERAAVCWLAAYEADLACESFGALAGAKVTAFYERRCHEPCDSRS